MTDSRKTKAHLTKEERYKKRKKKACDWTAWELYEREEAFALMLASVEGKGG